MTTYYHIQCKDWADRFISSHPGGRLIKITPTYDRVLGEVLMPDGSWQGLGWWDHYAVLYNGRVYDEAYPRGISANQFKARFKYLEVITFSPRI